MSETRKPDFFIIGAPKSGTTSLYNYLLQHPEIFMPELKEPHFFYNEEDPVKPVIGEKDLDSYLKLFEDAPEDKIAGEASTSYLYAPTAASEIQGFRPDAKIIAILRNPVDRAYSQYWNQVRDGVEPLTFEDALEAESERARNNWWMGFYYTGCGRYDEQLRRYFETFGPESVRIYLFEDLTRDTEMVCEDAFDFLGLDPLSYLETSRVHNSGGAPKNRLISGLLNAEKIKKPATRLLPPEWKRNIGAWLRTKNSGMTPDMDPETRVKLKADFREEILRLEDLIERDLQNWLT